MSKAKNIGGLALLVVAAFVLMNSIYTVSEVQQMIITQFGKPVGEPILSLIHISEPTRPTRASRMPSSA